MALPLSILDVSPIVSGANSRQALHNTIDLARFADQRGYTRFWLAEHHNSPGIASITPDIMIGQVARETSHIRVGSGGVMLPNHAPLAVAESFRLLEALFPGRIDLGIGRAPGTDMRTALALRRSQEALSADIFPQELDDLLAFSTDTFPPNHPFHTVKAYPNDVPLPPVWLLGSSGFSAQLAAELGLGFAFAHHIGSAYAAPAMTMYRKQFQPSASFGKPHAILAASVICAETDEEADDLGLSVLLAFLRITTGRSGALLSPAEVKAEGLSHAELAHMHAQGERHIIGSPQTVAKRLMPLIEATQADELMILTMVHDHQARKRSYDLLAELFDVQAVRERSAINRVV